MDAREYFSNFSRVFDDHFGYNRGGYNIEKLKEDPHYINEVSGDIESRLRDVSSVFKFLQIYKIGKLSWILDWSNKHDKFQYIKIYLGPYCYDEYDSKDKLEVKVMFLNEYFYKEREFI